MPSAAYNWSLSAPPQTPWTSPSWERIDWQCHCGCHSLYLSHDQLTCGNCGDSWPVEHIEIHDVPPREFAGIRKL